MKITVFLTRGGSLNVWNDKGILSRELQIYKELEKFGINTTLITYGNGSQCNVGSELGNIDYCLNKYNLPLRIYEKLIPLIHWKSLRHTDLIKTNQTNGALVALSAARIWKKPLISRCGYLWSEFAERDFGVHANVTQRAMFTENKVFTGATANVFTTQDMLDSATNRIGELSESYVIPNFVDTELFKPDEQIDHNTDVLFIGRFEKQKNLGSLLKATQIVDCSITLIGNGTLESQVKDCLAKNIRRTLLIDNVPHAEIPLYMRSAKVFVLPSYFEGHPKVLLEAMACGMAVVGADSPGIRNVIEHGKTGLLCSTEPGDIENAIQRLLREDGLRVLLGKNAREYVENNCSLSAVSRMESDLMHKLVYQV